MVFFFFFQLPDVPSAVDLCHTLVLGSLPESPSRGGRWGAWVTPRPVSPGESVWWWCSVFTVTCSTNALSLSPQLAYCVVQFLEKDSALTEPVSTAARSGPCDALCARSYQRCSLAPSPQPLPPELQRRQTQADLIRCYEFSSCSNFNYKSPCRSDSSV